MITFDPLLEHLLLVVVSEIVLVVAHLEHDSYFLHLAVHGIAAIERVFEFKLDLLVGYFVNEINEVHAAYVEGHDAVEQALQDPERSIVGRVDLQKPELSIELESDEYVVNEVRDEVEDGDVKGPSAG